MFDRAVDGEYLPWEEVTVWAYQYGVPLVPVLYNGVFDVDKIHELADGDSTIPEAKHIREGVVVKLAWEERTNPQIGRMILKYIGTEYELSRHKAKDTTDV